MRLRSHYNLHKAFPRYESRRYVTVNTLDLTLAKEKACKHFRAHAHEYQRAFRQYATRRYKCKPSAVRFAPIDESLHRIRAAVLDPKSEDCYGWTEGQTIYVSSALPMAFEQLVGTLLHEELHCFCRVRGRYLSADSEHHCMRVVGEEC